MKRTTLVIGASPNPERYAYKASIMLKEYGHTVVPYGLKKGNINGEEITARLPEQGIDTVTLYVGKQHQQVFYDYLVKLKPSRVIFNPGTENLELANLLKQHQIDPIEACTLVMLRTNQYE